MLGLARVELLRRQLPSSDPSGLAVKTSAALERDCHP